MSIRRALSLCRWVSKAGPAETVMSYLPAPKSMTRTPSLAFGSGKAWLIANITGSPSGLMMRITRAAS
jgi:hypothetical protein